MKYSYSFIQQQKNPGSPNTYFFPKNFSGTKNFQKEFNEFKTK